MPQLISLDNQVTFKRSFSDKLVLETFVQDVTGQPFEAGLIETEKEFTPIHDAMADAERRMTARHNFFFPGGHQTSEGEQAIVRDPAYRAAEADSAALEGQFYAALQKKKTAQASLKKALQTLKKSADTFDAYIQKKKTKWTGKSSVPAAEKAIKNARDYISDCLGLLK